MRSGALLEQGDPPRTADPATELRQRVLGYVADENTAGRGPTLSTVCAALGEPEGDVAGALGELITRRIVSVRGTDSPGFWATSSRNGGHHASIQ